MGRKDIFGILVNDEPRMCRKSVPGPSEGEFLSQFLRTKVDEIESSWPGRISATKLFMWPESRGRGEGGNNIHLPTNHLNPSRLSHPATTPIASNKVLAAHGMLLAVYVDKGCNDPVLVLDME